MLPDTGERYLSTPLFADVPADMTAEELAISRSTPGGPVPGVSGSQVIPAKRSAERGSNRERSPVFCAGFSIPLTRGNDGAGWVSYSQASENRVAEHHRNI